MVFMLKAATVAYLNSLPFSLGLSQLKQSHQIDWLEAIPADCAKWLLNKQVDLALLPVGALADFDLLYLASKYCIGSIGPVKTVKLCSHYEFEETKRIVFSKASRTSNLLVQRLADEYWHLKNIEWSYEKDLKSDLPTAFVIIGDEAFKAEHHFSFSVDLGQAWHDWTGLPFVFAIWVSLNPLEHSFQSELNNAFQEGIDQVMNMQKFHHEGISDEILQHYFHHNISYLLDDKKLKAIDLFLSKCQLRNPLNARD